MKYLNIFLSIAFLAATVATLRVNPVLKSNLMKQLSKKEQNHYKSIIKHRKNIYYQGLFFGLLLSILFIYYNKLKDKTVILFSALSITFVVNYFYYILYPKTDYMAKHLTTEKQRDAWLKIYKTMQFNYHFGFVLGLVGMFFVARAIC
jgi:hypothetical protein